MPLFGAGINPAQVYSGPRIRGGTTVRRIVFGRVAVAALAGWGYAQFDDGKPAGEAVHDACFACHAIVKERDFVFNCYAP
jgi:Cytochrome P460